MRSLYDKLEVRGAGALSDAELLTLLPNLWLAPSVYPGTKEDILRRFRCWGEMMASIGLPLIDAELLALADKFFQNMENEQGE